MLHSGNQDMIEKSQIDPYIKKQTAKLIQVIQNFFTKAVQIILQSRIDSGIGVGDEIGGPNSGFGATLKMNKWFNLYLQADDGMREELKVWKLCLELSQIPPMIIEVYLDLRSLTTRQVAVLMDGNGHPWTVAKGGSKKQEVVLERWLLEFDVSNVSGSMIDELPLIYKQAIVLFRSLYGYTRLMPVFRLKKNIQKSKLNKYSLKIGSKVADGKQPISSKGRIGLSKPIIPHQVLLTESHMSQKHFLPIRTTLGTLKVSVAYRNHCGFSTHDNEELLSTHFLNIDNDKGRKSISPPVDPDNLKSKAKSATPDNQIDKDNSFNVTDADKGLHNTRSSTKRFSLSSNTSMSVSPCSAPHITQGDSPSEKRGSVGSPPITHQRPSIKPFKIGSISSSPPPVANTGGGSSLERRISITSNKSTSNASLAALLRNPKNNTPSSTANIPITGANTHHSGNISVPRSVSSSHGSNTVHDNENLQSFSIPDTSGNTPRFSSSFGSRASRRFSNASLRHNSLTGGNNNDVASFLATSAGLGSSDTPLSGLYIDDDISDFVRMIDSKSDLRFSGYVLNADSKSPYKNTSGSQLNALNRFQSLKNQHQQLSDSVSASLVLHYNQVGSSRPSSRKSSLSVSSPPASLPSGSYDNSHLPSINSRLREEYLASAVETKEDRIPSSRGNLEGVASGASNNASGDDFTDFKAANNRTVNAAGEALTGYSDATHDESSEQTSVGREATKTQTKNHSPYEPLRKRGSSSKASSSSSQQHYNEKAKASNAGTGVSGLATTPSAYSNRAHIRYENVFEDEDDDEDFYLSRRGERPSYESGEKRVNFSSGVTSTLDDDDEDDDDLLFTMSDMHLAKQ